MTVRVVTEPRFIVGPGLSTSQVSMESVLEAFDSSRESARDQVVRDSCECYLRHLIQAAATEIVIPHMHTLFRPSLRMLRQSLAPSLAKRLRLADRSENIWTTSIKYLAPLLRWERLKSERQYAHSSELGDCAEELLWGFYLLTLAYRQRAELSCSLDPARLACSKLLTSKSLPGEASARVAVLAGLLSTYTERIELPTFTILASRDVQFAERMEDILDDAHFLEVSRLRRFLGLAQNRRAIIRDMRKLIDFIVRRKKWATNALAAGSALAIIPRAIPTTAERLLELVGSAGRVAPLVVDRPLPKFGAAVQVRGQRLLGGWSLRIEGIFH